MTLCLGSHFHKAGSKSTVGWNFAYSVILVVLDEMVSRAVALKMQVSVMMVHEEEG